MAQRVDEEVLTPGAFRIETPRLVLRVFEERDIEAFTDYRNDPEVARYQGWNVPYPLEQSARFVDTMRRMEPGKPGEWFQAAVERKSAPGIIGDVAFHRMFEDKRQAEIGYTLSREHWGQGYGTEAVAGLIDWLFSTFDLHRIRANIDPLNAASARLLEKAGMRREGTWIESLWFKGAWTDETWYAVLRREWEARRARER